LAFTLYAVSGPVGWLWWKMRGRHGPLVSASGNGADAPA
jgi:hypothetical protein